MVIDDPGSLERASMPLYIGDLVRCYRCLTDGQTLKDRATQLFIKYKSGALVTQFLQLGIIKLNLSYAQSNMSPNCESVAELSLSYQ